MIRMRSATRWRLRQAARVTAGAAAIGGLAWLTTSSPDWVGLLTTTAGISVASAQVNVLIGMARRRRIVLDGDVMRVYDGTRLGGAVAIIRRWDISGVDLVATGVGRPDATANGPIQPNLSIDLARAALPRGWTRPSRTPGVLPMALRNRLVDGASVPRDGRDAASGYAAVSAWLEAGATETATRREALAQLAEALRRVAHARAGAVEPAVNRRPVAG